jgi:hypothetical protein
VQSIDTCFHLDDSPVPLPLDANDAMAQDVTTKIVSLGTGIFTLQGRVDLTASKNSSQSGIVETPTTTPRTMMNTYGVTPTTSMVLEEDEESENTTPDLHKSPTEQTSSDDDEDDEYEETRLNLLEQTLEQQHCAASSSFVRVCDLNLHHHDHLRSSITTVCPHNEKHSGEWMAIPLSDCTMADSTTATTTVRPLMESLATMGLGTLMNTEIWTPDGKTNHIVSSSEKSWEGTTFSPPHLPSESDIPMDETTAASTDHVLVWTGTLVNCYGSDIPAVRSAAIMAMTAESLLDLLLDSGRVQEYNAMSLGRTDVQVLESCTLSLTSSSSSLSLESTFPRTVATKIVQSASRPPMLRKTLQFTTLLHARQYVDGYLIVSRAVTLPSSSSSSTTAGGSAVVVSEILLGVNWIRRVNDNQCLLVTVNHVKSPLIPLMLAKRLGLQAAVNFIHDVRRCCKAGTDCIK